MKKQITALLLGASLVFGGMVTTQAKEYEPSTTGMQYEQFKDYKEYLKGYTEKNRIMIFELDSWTQLEGYIQIKEVRGFTNGEKVFYKRHLLDKDNPLASKMEKGKQYLVVYDEWNLSEEGILEIIELKE